MDVFCYGRPVQRGEGRVSHNHQVACIGQFFLVQAKKLAESSFYTVSGHGIAHLPPNLETKAPACCSVFPYHGLGKKPCKPMTLSEFSNHGELLVCSQSLQGAGSHRLYAAEQFSDGARMHSSASALCGDEPSVCCGRREWSCVSGNQISELA